MQKRDPRKGQGQGLIFSLFLSGLLVILAGCGTQATSAPTSGTSTQPYNLHVAYFPTAFPSEVIIKKEGLWKKYLPPGTTITWDTEVIGPPIVANMLANKDQVGYLGDIPAFVATAKRSIADIRVVETNLFSPAGELCDVLLVRANAPQFANQQQALQWLNGKTIGVAGKGSCGDRFVTTLLKKEHITANVEYLDPTILLTSMKSGKIDAAQAFQPHIAQIVNEGVGRVVATGGNFNDQDGWFIIMRKDFIDQHHAVAVGWIKADIAAWQFIKQHPHRAIRDWVSQAPGYTAKQLWMDLYGRLPASSGASRVKSIVQISFTPAVQSFAQASFKFLYQDKILPISQPLPGALYPNLYQQAVKEMGVKLPLVTFVGQPASAFNPAKYGG